MSKEELSSFVEMDINVESSLKKREISDALLERLRESRKIFGSFEDAAMKEKNILNGLKLFSTAETCGLLLESSISELEGAREAGENPKSLEELKDILMVVSELGKRLVQIFAYENRREFDIQQSRAITLEIQEEGEKRGLIEPIHDRMKRTPLEIRESIAERVAPY